MNTKVAELTKINNFYFDHLLIRQSYSKHCSQMILNIITHILVLVSHSPMWSVGLAF